MKRASILSRNWLVVMAGTLGVLSGCSGQAAGPVATTLQLALSTPFDDDGALFFTITGGLVDSVDAAGYTVYTSRPDATTLQVILTGDLNSGNIAQLHIADERVASQYSARVNQVAARATYVERDPAAYRLDLKP